MRGVALLALLTPLAAANEPRTAGLVRQTTTGAVSVAPPPTRPGTLAIYPGFEIDTLETSVRAVLDAADACRSRGVAAEPPTTSSTAVPYLDARVVDGTPVELVRHEQVVECQARPLRRCTFTHVADTAGSPVVYASVQCDGAHDDPVATYVVTASLDLRKAERSGRVGTRRDRAREVRSITFQTTAFPGTHIVAGGERLRRDGTVRTPAMAHRFDDYLGTDTGTPLRMDALVDLVEAARLTTCRAVDACRGAAK